MKPILSDSAVSVFFDGVFSSPRLAHPEGIAVHSDGSVWAGTERGELVRITADGSGIELMGTSEGFLLGIAFDAAGNCYACDLKHAAIYRYDSKSGSFDRFASDGITVPNYPVVDDANGWLYVSDSLDPDGAVFRYDLKTGNGGRWTTQPLCFANGMAMKPDGSGLYVVESLKARLSFVPINSDGSPGTAKVVTDGLEIIPDGVLVMENGDILVSNYEPSRIYRWSERKGLELLVEDRTAHNLAHPTNIALKDGYLVTANLGRWHIARVDLFGLTASGEELDSRARGLAANLGLCAPEDVRSITPLTGGVASDIAVVDTGSRKVCMKFALPKLKVESDWFAPVHRNAAEYAWLETVAGWRSANVPQLYGRSEALSGFAMEFLDGQDIYLWKNALLAEKPDRGEAHAVGDALGAIHAASTAPDFDAKPFDNMDDFTALRIEPYLTYTATVHPEQKGDLTSLADGLKAASQVLVHGDVSPKNIIMRAEKPVFLDAECATMGDASFDPAFCLNHLLLKAIHLPHSRTRLLASARTFWEAYAPHVCWEDAAELEARICRLLPALMLARVDGRSPVEYLDQSERARTRALALDILALPLTTLWELTGHLDTSLKETAP